MRHENIGFILLILFGLFFLFLFTKTTLFLQLINCYYFKVCVTDSTSEGNDTQAENYCIKFAVV